MIIQGPHSYHDLSAGCTKNSLSFASQFFQWTATVFPKYALFKQITKIDLAKPKTFVYIYLFITYFIQ